MGRSRLERRRSLAFRSQNLEASQLETRVKVCALGPGTQPGAERFQMGSGITFPLFCPSQVAQWPKKEEEEQPMFDEEYDW